MPGGRAPQSAGRMSHTGRSFQPGVSVLSLVLGQLCGFYKLSSFIWFQGLVFQQGALSTAVPQLSLAAGRVGRAAGPVAGRERGSLCRVSTAGVGSCEGPATLSLDACPWLGVCPKQRVTGWSPSRGAGALLFTGGPLSRGARASVLTCPSLCCPRCGPGHLPALALSGFTFQSPR